MHHRRRLPAMKRSHRRHSPHTSPGPETRLGLIIEIGRTRKIVGPSTIRACPSRQPVVGSMHDTIPDTLKRYRHRNRHTR